MMEADSIEVLPIHRYKMYLEACCDLINSEWKRSHVARMVSLEKSCDDFPTSLVMVNNGKDVVGHSKLSLIPSIQDACFVESVVIDKSCRGRGWGKLLMMATEDYARNYGLQEIYLSAIDPVPAFYEKLGYVQCPPICIYGGPVGGNSPRTSPATVTPVSPWYNLHRGHHRRPTKIYMRKSLYDSEL